MSNGSAAASETMSDTESQPGNAVDAIQEVMHHYLEAATVEAVYGEPIRIGETLVVPAAEVVSIFGFGMGAGSGTAPGRDAAGERGAATSGGEGGGGGGGGGGRVLSRPVAVVVITPGAVRVEPIVDVTKLGMAALTAIGFMFMTMLRMGSRRRALPNAEDD